MMHRTGTGFPADVGLVVDDVDGDRSVVSLVPPRSLIMT
jgi:hypothetical protein